MTSPVGFQSVPQTEGSVTITVPLSRSNNSCLTWKKITIGAIGVGITTVAAAVYFLSAKSANTENPELSLNQSSLSLYNISMLVEQPPRYFEGCIEYFTDHLNSFKECGVDICACMLNAEKVFKLFCNTYAAGIVNTPDECKEASSAMGRCELRSC